MTAITSPARRGRAGTRVGGISDVARSSTAPYSMAAGKNHDVLQKKNVRQNLSADRQQESFLLTCIKRGWQKIFQPQLCTPWW